MYFSEYTDQLSIENFILPFDGKLNSENRWAKLAQITPWKEIEDHYTKVMSTSNGRAAYTARIAFGAIFIKQSEKLSDESTVTYIQENPYAQFYLGLTEFHEEPLFDSSMMVHFRKRFPVEFIAEVNEYICTGKWPENKDKVDKNDNHHDDDTTSNGSSDEDKTKENESKEDKSEEAKPDKEENKPENAGTLIMDATVAPSDIKFPTDIDLLNRSREIIEKAIDLLWPYVKHKGHKYPYNKKKARKSFLNISKSKKWTRKKVKNAISDQLNYVNLGLKQLDEMKKEVDNWTNILYPWIKARLEVIPTVYKQQYEMFTSGKNSCENRIVSLSQPFVRPIVRGKRPNPTEFGQKLHLSVVDGYTFIEQTSWNAFNEATYLKNVCEEYKRKYGYYPVAVLADKIYQNRENRAYCKEHNIRISGPALGRPKKAEEEKKEQKEQMYKDACDRNAVEGRNGNLKRRYRLDLIMSKLDETAKTEAAIDILVMNSWVKIRRILLRFFSKLLILGDYQYVILKI